MSTVSRNEAGDTVSGEAELTEPQKAAIWDHVDGFDSNYGHRIGPRERAAIAAALDPSPPAKETKP